MGEIAMTSRPREPVNSYTHLVAGGLAFLGLVSMIFLGWGDSLKLITFSIYGISLILMFMASGIYHWVDGSDSKLLKFRKFDHAAIYLLIAGTYTPICIHFFDGFWQFGMLIVVWSLALIGIMVKIFIIHAPRWVTAGVYLFMGWLSIMGVNEILTEMPKPAIFWLVAGGLFYSIGAIIYITKKLDLIPGKFGFHEIWHIFVILGAFSHFYVIFRFIALSF